MRTSPATSGKVFVCEYGHIDKHARQLKKKGVRFCNKVGCYHPVTQVSSVALKNVYNRGRQSVMRILFHTFLGTPL